MTSEAAAAPPEVQDIRPLVARPVSNRGPWIFGAILLASAAGLFAALDARRTAITSPAIAPDYSLDRGVISAAPELVIPPDYSELALPGQQAMPLGSAEPLQQSGVILPPSRSGPMQFPAPGQPLPPYPLPQQPLPATNAPQAPAGPAFAYRAPGQKPALEPTGAAKSTDERANASMLLNPATTVPQGTVIQAVLETALDSNRAGFARAVVSRDVSSFDGSHVLIPKGSKLFGEYKADLSAGQNRALIQWRRLTRPDGGIVDVDSPSADPLGRAGIKGKVNNHFFAKFGGAILQSALDIGVQVAARQATGDTIIIGGYPYGNYGGEAAGNLRNALPRQENIKPTLTVKQGTSVSVFVVRDLDFTEIEQ